MNWQRASNSTYFNDCFRVCKHHPKTGGQWELGTRGTGARIIGLFKTLREAKNAAEAHLQTAALFGPRPVVIR